MILAGHISAQSLKPPDELAEDPRFANLTIESVTHKYEDLSTKKGKKCEAKEAKEVAKEAMEAINLLWDRHHTKYDIFCEDGHFVNDGQPYFWINLFVREDIFDDDHIFHDEVRGPRE